MDSAVGVIGSLTVLAIVILGPVAGVDCVKLCQDAAALSQLESNVFLSSQRHLSPRSSYIVP